MSNRKTIIVAGLPSKVPPEVRGNAVVKVLYDGRPIAEVGRAVGVHLCAIGSAWSAPSAVIARG
jgi:hypothetical protein